MTTPAQVGRLTIYLLEELGDARLRCDEVKRYVDKATTLVNNSKAKDHLFEVAGDLIHALPTTLLKLEKALAAAAMAGARLDYESMKGELRPEKADELDQVMEAIRMRDITRRSSEKSAMELAYTRDILAHASSVVARVDCVAPVGRVLVALISSLEKGQTKKASAEEAPSGMPEIQSPAVVADILGKVAARMGSANPPSPREVAAICRKVLAETYVVAEEKQMAQVLQQAGSREEVMDGFKQSNPDLTDSQLKEIADQWEKNKDVVKDIHAKSASGEADPIWDVASALRQLFSQHGRSASAINKLPKKALDTYKKALDKCKEAESLFEAAAKEAANREARFESGKPADPTQHMSPEDAATWKDMNEKYRDVVKDQHSLGVSPMYSYNRQASKSQTSYTYRRAMDTTTPAETTPGTPKSAGTTRVARGKWLPDHYSMETAYLVDDYPYGRQLRCRIRYWIEFDAKKGYRFCAQTEDPKTLRWNNPKKSTYSHLAMEMYLDSRDYVQYASLDEYSKPAQVEAFLWDFPRSRCQPRIHLWAKGKVRLYTGFIEGTVSMTVNGVKKPWTEQEQGEHREDLEAWTEVLLASK